MTIAADNPPAAIVTSSGNSSRHHARQHHVRTCHAREPPAAPHPNPHPPFAPLQEKPGLRLMQYKSMIFERWQKDPRNPRNQRPEGK